MQVARSRIIYPNKNKNKKKILGQMVIGLKQVRVSIGT